MSGLPVIHATPLGSMILDCTNLETGERAIVITEPRPKAVQTVRALTALHPWPQWFRSLLIRRNGEAFIQ